MDPIVFLNAINGLCKENDIPQKVVVEALENGFASAYRRHYKSSANVKVDIDMNTGNLKVRAYRTVVDELEDEDLEILIEEAKEIDPSIEIGERIYEEVTPADFGRVAISTAKQVVIQKLKEFQKERVMEEFKDKEHTLLLGQVTREDEMQYYVDLGKVHGLLPKKELIPNEKIEMESRIRVFVAKIENEGKNPLILLSRKHFGFVRELFNLEIPEVSSGDIEIKSVAREAGIRSKVAVASYNENIDPVGTCIGEKGSRINRVLKELNGEKIDVVAYSDDITEFVTNAMAPAKVIRVIKNEGVGNELTVIVDKENFSLAIGRSGINVKLAAKITRCKLDVKTLDEFINQDTVEVIKEKVSKEPINEEISKDIIDEEISQEVAEEEISKEAIDEDNN